MHYKEYPEIEIPPFLRGGGWEDQSWRNDACAKSQCFLAFHPDGEPTHVVTVWVNFEHPEDRDTPDRFMVEIARNRSEWENGTGPTLYQGESEVEAEKVVREYLAGVRQ